MDEIKVLSPVIANMIAAGEVVERPSSVVKELIENSIDANSTKIEIKIFEVGRTLISVKDNGSGMSRENALLAFTRHATSKIRDEHDLFKIMTLGFRGEALPSIGAVSHVTLETSDGLNVGTKIRYHGDKMESVEPSSSLKGTYIEVKELFFNTPARLKYLKSDYTELANIQEVVAKSSLANPNIAFSLYFDEKIVFSSSGKGDLHAIIADVYGVETAKNMISVSFSNTDFEVHGFIGESHLSKASRNYMLAFINGRSVRLPILQVSLMEAYRDYISSDRYPMAILHIQVDPQLVDINVHPSKHEVRLSKEKELMKLIVQSVKDKLSSKSMFPTLNESKTVKQEEVLRPQLNLDFDWSAPKEEILQKITPQTNQAVPSFVESIEKIKVPIKDSSFLIKEEQESFQTSKVYALAQIHGTYILASNEQGLLIIDQHAAAERINYEKFSKKIKEESQYIQLLIPLLVELSMKDMQKVMEKISLFKEVGLEVEPFGHTSLRVSAIPIWMQQVNVKQYAEMMVEQLINKGKVDPMELRSYAVASLACKASIRANHPLTIESMQDLINELYRCENPHNCPHGRPTIIKYTIYELEKAFKRVGS